MEHVHIFALFFGKEQEDSSSPKLETDERLRHGIHDSKNTIIIWFIFGYWFANDGNRHHILVYRRGKVAQSNIFLQFRGSVPCSILIKYGLILPVQ